MSKITDIEQKIKQLDGGAFQELCDAYLYNLGYTNIASLGSHTGTQKSTKGTPDTYFYKHNGKYVVVMYTTVTENLFKKIKDDIVDCLNPDKIGIQNSDIEQIIYCHNSSNITIEEDKELRNCCAICKISLDIKCINTISQDIYHRYPKLAKDFLYINIDTDQIFKIDDFINIHDYNSLVAPLSIKIYYRENDISEILKLLEQNSITILSGAAGVGKTRLAIEICKTYQENHLNTKTFCLRNNGQNIYDDLKSYINEKGEYLFFVDDANEITTLNHLLDYLNKTTNGINLKILMTVRDYAKSYIVNLIHDYSEYDFYNVKRLQDEQIKEILKCELRIKNEEYLNRIINIALGNPRIAILAGKIAIDKQTIMSILDVTQLYEIYFSRIVEKIIADDVILLKVAGLLAFFKTIDFENKSIVIFFMQILNINEVELLYKIKELHELEIIDLCENKVAKISDQSMGTYLLYYVFVKKCLLSFSEVIKCSFPKNKKIIIDSYNALGNLFRTQEVYDILKSEATIVWEELKRNNDPHFFEFLLSFHLIRQEEALLYVKNEIDNLENEEFDLKVVNIKEIVDFRLCNNQILELLCGYENEENFSIALDLMINYYKKKPSIIKDIYFCLTNNINIETNSFNIDYKPQVKIIEKLLFYSQNFMNEEITFLFVLVGEYYSKILFSSAKSGRGMTFVFNQVPLSLTNGSKLFRSQIWESFIELYNNSLYKDLIIEAFIQYGYSHIDVDESVFHFDKKFIINFICECLDFENIQDCIFVGKIVERFKYLKIEINDCVNSFLENPLFKTYLTIIGYKHLDEFDYEKEKELQTIDISKLIIDFSANDYYRIFIFLNEIKNFKGVEEYKLIEGIVILFNLIDKDTFIIALYEFIHANTQLNINPFILVKKLIDSIGVYEAESFIKENIMNNENIWKISWIDCIPNDLADEKILKIYYEILDKLEPDNMCGWLPMQLLIKLQKFDKDIFVNTFIKLINNPNINSNHYAILLYDIFNVKENEANKLIGYFQSSIKVLKDMYLSILSLNNHNNHFDYHAYLLKQLIIVDKTIINDIIDFNIENKSSIHNYSGPRLSVLWKIKNPLELVFNTVERYIKKCGNEYFHIFEYLESLFVIDDISLCPIQDEFLKNYINKYSNNKEYIEILFYIISTFEMSRKKEMILYLLKKNLSFNIFECINIEPSFCTWSGSEIPRIDKRIEFYDSLLIEMNSIDLLEHKQLINNRIQCLIIDKKNAKIREFIESYNY